jgi:glycosyltransferase involved in cell wall biosynthesis
LAERVVHFGYAPDAATYSRLLWQADVVVSTALHDFFGAAVIEACYCGCFPVLPRRLAYPELIPAAHHEACLYDDFEGLLARLRYAITHVQATRAFGRSLCASLQEHVARFDWKRMAPLYDAVLAPLVRGAEPL